MKKPCSIDGCERPINARGLCGLHYSHARNRGEFGAPCTAEGCDKPRISGGLCSTHHKRKWCEENREQYNAHMREYLKGWREREDPEKLRARHERYRKNNLGKFANKERSRRAKKRSGGGSYRVADWIRLVRQHGGKCAYCREQPATTADHVIPLARGGSNYIGNILPACVACNCSKQDRLITEWKKWKRTRNQKD